MKIPSEYLINLKSVIENPTGIWADYSPVHKLWEKLVEWSGTGQIDSSDVPNEPDVTDYTDIVSERTIHVGDQGTKYPNSTR